MCAAKEPLPSSNGDRKTDENAKSDVDTPAKELLLTLAGVRYRTRTEKVKNVSDTPAKELLPTLSGVRYRDRLKRDKYAYEEERGVRYETKGTDEKIKSESDPIAMEETLPTSNGVKGGTKTEKDKNESDTPPKEQLPTLAGYNYKPRKRDKFKKDKYAYEEERGVRYETKNTDEKIKSEFDPKAMEPLPTSIGARMTDENIMSEFDYFDPMAIEPLPTSNGVKYGTKTEKVKNESDTAPKEQLPTLRAYRFKTRKRDEKVKYDAKSFANTVISKLNETDGSPEALSSVLAKEGETLDYRRYAESLLEILIAGGILAPGGKVESDPPSSFCVFSATPTVTSLKLYLQRKQAPKIRTVLHYKRRRLFASLSSPKECQSNCTPLSSNIINIHK